MWEKILVIFTIPELRRKIYLTLLLLAVFRLGSWISLPFVDSDKMRSMFAAGENEGIGNLMQKVATFAATDLDRLTIFGLGIMPYISASIILQLLATFYAPLKELQKEGESGRKKVNEYTRYLTVFISLIQSGAYLWKLPAENSFNSNILVNGSLPFSWLIVGTLTMTAGTVFLMWLGEQIDEYGIGNGISLLIMAGILSRMPQAGMELMAPIFKGGLELGGGPGKMGVETLVVLAALFVAVVFGVVFITQGQRRITTQSAKHVRGRRVFGGTRAYLPLRVNQSGVMPIIFASSLLMIPALLFEMVTRNFPTATWLVTIGSAFSHSSSFIHNILYIALIYFFCYFWTSLMFNPQEVSENLKSAGSFIPGYRPGRRTADYLDKVMVRITYVGAGFLALVAILPTLVSLAAQIDPTMASFYGGTSLLIAVSVAFDLVQKVDSHLVMRNYRGLLEKS